MMLYAFTGGHMKGTFNVTVTPQRIFDSVYSVLPDSMVFNLLMAHYWLGLIITEREYMPALLT